MLEIIAKFFKSFSGLSTVWAILLLVFIVYFVLVIVLNLISSQKHAKAPRGSYFMEKFISTNYELLPYLTETEKELMRETLNNTLKNQKIGEMKDDGLNSGTLKVKKNKSVKIAEKKNSYHYINVKSEIICNVSIPLA